MELKIKNKNIEIIYKIFSELPITKMKANRGRAKLLKKLEEKFNNFIEDRKEILELYVEFDKEGKPISNDGKLQFKEDYTEKDLTKDIDELANELIIIQSGEYSNRFIDLFDDLENLEVQLSAQEIILLDELLEQYENQKGEHK